MNRRTVVWKRPRRAHWQYRSTRIFVVFEGEVDLLIKGEFVKSLCPGGVPDEIAIPEHVSRSASPAAKTACRLVAIDEKRFKFPVQQTPNFVLSMLHFIADRLNRMDDRI